MIIVRLPNPSREYNERWAYELVRGIERNTESIDSTFNTTYANSPGGYFGMFYDTTSQTPAMANTAYPVTFNTTSDSNGVSVVSTTDITISKKAVYTVKYNIHFTSPIGTGAFAWSWLRLNGVDVAGSAIKEWLHTSTPSNKMVASNFTLFADKGDVIQLIWASDSTDTEITAAAASSPIPAVPSVILSIVEASRV